MKTMTTKRCIYCLKEYQRPLTEAKRQNMKFCSISCGVSSRNITNKKTPIELFYKNTIIPENTDDCWIWKCNKTSRYGVIKVDSKPKLVHRFSYEYFNGPIPNEMYICHHCDTTKCVNPKHLFIGTPKDNCDDKMKKGRHKARKGEEQGNAKLTNNQVREIKQKLREGMKRCDIAMEYNARALQIGKIARGEQWKCID